MNSPAAIQTDPVDFTEFVERIGKATDLAGVALISVGALVATGLFLHWLRGPDGFDAAYVRYRHALGRAILLGLELLVAADIIRTVAVTPTFRTVGVLAAIVVIRTFLSMTLELEINSRWPWQRREGVPPAT